MFQARKRRLSAVRANESAQIGHVSQAAMRALVPRLLDPVPSLVRHNTALQHYRLLSTIGGGVQLALTVGARLLGQRCI
jgi:hypothetical protein